MEFDCLDLRVDQGLVQTLKTNLWHAECWPEPNVFSVCMCSYWIDGCKATVSMSPVHMTQSFVCGWHQSWGQEDSQKDTIHQTYHLLQTSELPVSLCFGLKLESSLSGEIYFNTLSFFVSDVPQDTLATPCSDRDVVLAAMKSMVQALLWFRSRFCSNSLIFNWQNKQNKNYLLDAINF